MGHMSPLLQSYRPAPFCHCSFPHGNNNDNKHFNSRIASPRYCTNGISWQLCFLRLQRLFQKFDYYAILILFISSFFLVGFRDQSLAKGKQMSESEVPIMFFGFAGLSCLDHSVSWLVQLCLVCFFHKLISTTLNVNICRRKPII